MKANFTAFKYDRTFQIKTKGSAPELKVGPWDSSGADKRWSNDDFGVTLAFLLFVCQQSCRVPHDILLRELHNLEFSLCKTRCRVYCIFLHANPISQRFQPGDFCPPEIRVCVSMYWRLSQRVESLFRPLVWNHFSDPWGWKHFSVPGTETVSKWFHPRDGKLSCFTFLF